MSKTTKQITKIKINGDGLKGLEVHYQFPNEKDNLLFTAVDKKIRTHPIHEELEVAIGDLRNFMLELNGYYNESVGVMEKDQLILESKITEINIGGVDSFKITGELRTYGDKFSKIPGIEIESADGYEYFGAVMAIIAKVTEETHEYMAGKKKLDEAAFMMKFAKMKNDDVMVQEFSKMSNKEKRDKCTEILEKMGAVVLINDELEIDNMDVQLEVTEVEEIIPISTPMAEIIPTAIPEPVKEEIIPTEPIVIPISAPKFQAPAF